LTRSRLSGLLLMLMVAGCNLGGGPPPPEGQLAIENVAKWYQLYRADHRGKAPPDEDAFVEFIQERMSARGETVDREQLLTSPRDGQPYVVQYGDAAGKSRNIEKNVAVYEQEGYRGKKLVAFEAAWSREVDDPELQSLLAGE
jgi:hypothetical protein